MKKLIATALVLLFTSTCLPAQEIQKQAIQKKPVIIIAPKTQTSTPKEAVLQEAKPNVKMQKSFKKTKPKLHLRGAVKAGMVKLTSTVSVRIDRATTAMMVKGPTFKSLCNRLTVTSQTKDGKSRDYKIYYGSKRSFGRTTFWCLSKDVRLPANEAITFTARLDAKGYYVATETKERTFKPNENGRVKFHIGKKLR